jgi:hypothetical protein
MNCHTLVKSHSNAVLVSVIAGALLSWPTQAAGRIWPDPGTVCRPLGAVLAPGSEKLKLSVSPIRTLTFPNELKISERSSSYPTAGRVRIHSSVSGWRECEYSLDLETPERYLRTQCSGSGLEVPAVDSLEVIVSLPSGGGAVRTEFAEPAPCFDAPRSEEGTSWTSCG